MIFIPTAAERAAAQAVFGRSTILEVKRLRREEHRCVECGIPTGRYTEGCATCGARARSCGHTPRQRLRVIYENNLANARNLGQQWAVNDFASRLDDLDRHPRGKLTGWLLKDARHFGVLFEEREVSS